MRPNWNEYFLEMADVAKKRSTCQRRQIGALIVKDNRVLSTGYNGAPSGLKHCEETGCLREELNIPSGQNHELCRGLHAEQNAIIQAAKHGVNISGATLFCTNQPCVICSKMIINSGITKIVYRGDYPDELAISMLKEADVTLEIIK